MNDKLEIQKKLKIDENTSNTTFDRKFFTSRHYKIRQGIKQRKRGLEYSLDPDYLMSIFPKDSRCPVLKTKFIKNSQQTPSVDRIDNSKGYVKGNVLWVSKRVNSIKRDSTYDFILKIANYYKNL